jgi:LacI family transcriptional regulator
VIPDITNPFFPALVQAIEHAARAHGLGILIADADNNPEVESSALRTLVDRRVDAVLISPTHVTESLPALREAARTVPVVQIDRVIDVALPFVRVDQAAPVETIAKHLRASGREHLAFIGQQATISTSLERERAFVRLMAELFPGDAVRILPGAMSARSGREAAREIQARWPETDAIICANDLIAVGVLQQLGSHRGRRTVAVSGFDDTLIAHAMHLTSVRQPVDELAHAAISAAAETGAPQRDRPDRQPDRHSEDDEGERHMDADEPVLLVARDLLTDEDLHHDENEQHDRANQKSPARLAERDDREDHGRERQDRHNVGDHVMRADPAIAVIL